MGKRKGMVGPQLSEPVKCEVGLLYGRSTMFFREACGTAKSQDGSQYELSINVGGSLPIIRSEKTGRWWSITWDEMLKLAINSGIDEPEVRP